MNLEINNISKEFFTELDNILNKYLKSKSLETTKDDNDLYTPTKDMTKEQTTCLFAHLAKNLGGSPKDIFNICDNPPKDITSGMLLELLMEIGKFYDKAYPDNLRQSPTLFTFSLEEGRIVPIKYPQNIKKFVFPAFRDLESAKVACYICRKVIKMVYRTND